MGEQEYVKRLYHWFMGELTGPPPLITIRAHGPNLRERNEKVKMHTFAFIHHGTGDYMAIGKPETSGLHIVPDVQRSIIDNFVVPPNEEKYQREQIASAGMPDLVTDDMLVSIARANAAAMGLPIGFFAFGHTVVRRELVAFLCAILYVPYEKVLEEIRQTMPPVGT